MSTSVAVLWRRLAAWREKHAPGTRLRLRPPAAEKAIAAAEKKMKLAFPPDFRASLLVHDGEEDYDGDPKRFEWMPGCDRLAPLDAIVAQWKDERENDDADLDDVEVVERGRFRDVLSHAKRIPIAGSPNWDGDNTYLDLVPGPKGTVGQLATMVTECDFTVIDSSFQAALQRYVDALESGAWIVSETYRGPKRQESGHLADLFATLRSRRARASGR